MKAEQIITKDVMKYKADSWILGKTPKKQKMVYIRMYMPKRQKEALYRLRDRFGCTNWKEFAAWLIEEYEIKYDVK